MKKIYLLLLAVLFTTIIKAQVTGIKTIGVDYPTFAAAITDLNSTGVGAGGATINVPAGYTETAPVGGYLLGTSVLNASLSAANPLLFQKSGAGANPVLTAPVGTSITVDGIFILAGTDYVTINGINLNDPNTGTPASMEWGFAMVNLNGSAPFDGCQFVTIQNCNVTLNRLNPNFSFGIYSGHVTASSTTALTITAAADAHSNNKIYANTISNASFGIFLSGFAAASPTLFDQNNDVGGNSPATGNTISNTANVTGANAFGIYMANHNGANASYNTINYFQGAGSTAVAYGIYFFGATSTATANNNTISVGQASGSGVVAGIYAQNTGSVVATNNQITFSDAGGSGTHYGVFTATATTTDISSNTFSANNTGSVTGTYYFIYDASTGTGETFNNNTFSGINISTTSSAYLIYASNSTPNVTATNNTITGGFTKTGSGGTFYGYYNFGSPGSGTATITGNNFQGITLSGTTAGYGIYQATGTGQLEIVNNNTVTSVTTATGTFIGIHHNYGAAGSTASGNTVSQISGTGTITGIQLGTSTASLGLTASQNNVFTLNSTGASTVTGILHTAGVNSVISKNKIYDLQSNNASGFTNGITLAGATSGTNVTVVNNLIGDLRSLATTSATDGVRGINITATGTTSNFNIYYNSIYLNATSSGANFSTSGLYHTYNTTATTAALTLRNNIIVNNSTPNGTGLSAAFRRSASTNLNNFNTASDRNLFYSGAPSASKLIYYDGTNSDQTLVAYKARVAPRDANSVTENPPFLSTTGSSANFLHINPAIATLTQGLGTAISGIIDDFDGDVRNGSTPDIGADEFSLCTGAVGGTAAITGSSTFCGSGTPVITASGYSAGVGSGYQWFSSTNIANYPASGTVVSGQTNPSALTTGVVSTTTYYWLRVTCPQGTATAYSNMLTITINPSVASVTPSAPGICEGQSVTLTENGGTGTSWSWSPGGATTQAITVSPLVTTTYTVTVNSPGGCVANANVTVSVNPVPAGVTASASTNNICLGSSVNLFSTVNTVPAAILSQNFEAGTGSWAIVNTSTGGTDPTLVAWTLRNSGYSYSTDVFTGNQGTNFVMANSDAAGSGVTAFTTITSPAFSTIGYTGLNLSFIHYYRHITAAGAFVEVSTNGSTWTTVQSYGATTGTAAAFVPANINLDAYVGNPTVYVRFRFAGGWYYYWAIDDIAITGTPIAYTFNWTSSPAGFSSALQNPTGVAPTVNTTYTVVVTGIGGCTSTANTAVNVNTPNVSGLVVQPSTCVSTDGSITLTVTGGTGGVGPYSYAWTGPGVNPTSQNQTNLGVASYTVIVTDVPSGCTNTMVFSLPGPGGCNICPAVPTLTTNPTPAVCQNANVILTASGLANMGVTYGITFKQSTVALADPYVGGTIITTIPNGGLSSGGTVATATTTFAATGNYFIYAILSPLPVDPACRPFAQTSLTVNGLPTVNAIANQSVCTGASTAAVNFTGAIPGTVYNWTNNTTSIGLAASGTGNIASFTAINTGITVVTATITVTPSYTGGGTTCTGTARTFTITVNPNPTLVIAADPGTTLCEGDPTLLTVKLGTATPPGNLYAQTSGVTLDGPPSQFFEPANVAFNCQAADDFIVPGGASWTVTRVTASGTNTGSGVATSVNVFFYNNSGANLPGTVVASYTNVATFTQAGGVYTVNLPAPLALSGGTYWVSVQPNMAFATSGQWFWGTYGTTNIGNEHAWQNPGGGFGTPCSAWGYGATGCGVGGGVSRNLIFTVYGTSITGGGSLPPGYTFLWTPAAGLSSTTTNPVAASPMNTTTYTVNTTTAAGCTNSAQITITVNKRPVVTTQPVSRTNCSGTSATFTVAGTGTNLTYQWQVSTAGCAGPWTNLVNGTPYSNVTTSTLIVNPVTLAMTGYAYRCVLGGTCAPGIPPLNISSCAVLTVNALPTVTVTPASSCGGVAGINGLALTASGANTYTWSPTAGLYSNATATTAYTGGNINPVYAAPTVYTVYTVTGTNSTTGCSSTASAFINYTPPAPTVTPSSVTMCLGDPAVRLVSSSSSTSTITASSGPISVAIPDGTGAPGISTLNIAGVPAASIIGEVKVTMNINHTWVGDVDVNLKAPNNAILNLVGALDGGTGSNSSDNFTNTAFSSLGGTTISGAAAPRTGTYAAEARAGYGPTGYIQTVNNWAALTPTAASANGAWTLAMGDFAATDTGTLTSWSISVSYITGVPSTPATWSPITGLYNNSAATIAYTGDARDTVWTRPTPAGIYPYQVTVQSLPAPPVAFTNPAAISIPIGGTGTPYPSNLTVSGLPATGVTVKSVVLNGLSHTWSEDVDVLLQSPTGVNVILMSDVGAATVMSGNVFTFADSGPAMSATGANPSGTYKPTNNGATDDFPAPGPGTITQANPAISMFTGNYNGVWKLFAVDDDGIGDQGNISGGFTINFDLGAAACTSPARTVVVTVNQPATVATQPVNKTVCTDKVATFSVAAAGSGPFSYQWQVSTNSGNTYSNIANGGVYSGATSASLTITAPPVSMSGYLYRVVITGAAPCAPVTSFQALLTVNPLPTIVIGASPYTSLFPGLRTTLSSTVTPNAAAANGYTWLRNGTVVAGANTGTLNVDVDGLGDYSLRVTDVNGCTNTSNTISIKDSVSSRCFIYPNPTSGQFQVRYHSVATNVLPRGIVVYDSKGDRVFLQNYTIGRPYDRMDVDMRAYGKGLYWVEIVDLNGNRITMCRVVIQ